MKALKRLNDALPLLVATILCYGAACGLIGVWFVKNRPAYVLGILIGTLCAVFMAVHIAMVLRDAVDVGATDGNTRMLSAKSALRYLIVAAVILGCAAAKIGDPIAMFIGVFGLKIAAYLQPLLKKLPFLRSDTENENTGMVTAVSENYPKEPSDSEEERG